MLVILDRLVFQMTWALGSGKSGGRCGIWRLGIRAGEASLRGGGASSLLLGGCPGRCVGAHVLLFLHV